MEKDVGDLEFSEIFIESDEKRASLKVIINNCVSKSYSASKNTPVTE